ncbi:hypothetical protein HDA40_002313 [Hamadaea flava]|uniref:Uncharacterized protein n=1 Tax=Hamadaea flava TaxID=1742688 RepID=A0ABV8LM01_9ACTN|nr:hypothetical protein [Hamadaea flava]MCP2323806.1 hypothetical protein [Hamadaea flava]
MHNPRRLLIQGGAAVLAAAMTLVAAVPAYAAAPANDTIAGAVAIGALPFSTTLDTTEATTEKSDAEANPADCGAPSTDASVWYDLTLPADDIALVDVSASNYGAGVLVVNGDPGFFKFVTCGPGAVAFDVTAGTTYHLMIIDDQQDGTGNGGDLHLSVTTAPPPPDLSVTVDPTGSFDKATGAAIIHGTATCTGQVDFGGILADVIQKVGRGVVYGFGETELACDGTTESWSITAIPSLGTKFAGGKTATVSLAYACGPVFCNESYQEYTVQLKHNG